MRRSCRFPEPAPLVTRERPNHSLAKASRPSTEATCGTKTCAIRTAPAVRGRDDGPPTPEESAARRASARRLPQAPAAPEHGTHSPQADAAQERRADVAGLF